VKVPDTNDRQLGLRLATNSAKGVHQRFGIQSAEHIVVPAIAAALGVKVVEGKLDGAQARLLHGPVPTIRVSDAVPLEEQRFGVAHELGHFVGDHPPAQVEALCQRGRVRPVPKGYKRHPEAEANRFAAELLLPSTLLTKRFDAQHPSLHFISEIAAEYKVPLLCAAIRHCELTSERCCAVYSEHGKVLWAVSSPTFSSRIARGHLLDPRSVAYDFQLKGTLDERPQPITAAAWLSTAEDVELIEHSLMVPNRRGVITLLWVQEAIAEQLDMVG
jgi:Zn-dependent peptidase ImmA (M78 family)